MIGPVMKRARTFRLAGNLNYTRGCEQAEALRDSVSKRFGCRPDQIECPRAASETTPCVARDGGLAVYLDSAENARCVSCESYVASLWAREEVTAGKKANEGAA